MTVPANLIKRQKQHFHHYEDLGEHCLSRSLRERASPDSLLCPVQASL